MAYSAVTPALATSVATFRSRLSDRAVCAAALLRCTLHRAPCAASVAMASTRGVGGQNSCLLSPAWVLRKLCGDLIRAIPIIVTMQRAWLVRACFWREMTRLHSNEVFTTNPAELATQGNEDVLQPTFPSGGGCRWPCAVCMCAGHAKKRDEPVYRSACERTL